MSTHDLHPRRLAIVLAVSAFAVALLAGPAAASGSDAASGGQRFVPSVVGAFNGLSTRADALGFHRRNTAEASLCRHYQVPCP